MDSLPGKGEEKRREESDKEVFDSLFRNLRSLAAQLGRAGVPEVTALKITDVNRCESGVQMELVVRLHWPVTAVEKTS